MRITILGTGMIAAGLGSRWSRAGHELTIAGRNLDKSQALAAELSARSATIRDAVADAEVVLLAVSWDGVADVLRAAGPMPGVVLIDPTNAVDQATGALRLPTGESGAQRIATLSPGAHVVKAFHLFVADQWRNVDSPPVTVAISGDDPRAIDITRTLIRDAGSEPAVLGGLDRARQLEDAASFVITMVMRGVNPRTTVPDVRVNLAATAN